MTLHDPPTLLLVSTADFRLVIAHSNRQVRLPMNLSLHWQYLRNGALGRHPMRVVSHPLDQSSGEHNPQQESERRLGRRASTRKGSIRPTSQREMHGLKACRKVSLHHRRPACHHTKRLE